MAQTRLVSEHFLCSKVSAMRRGACCSTAFLKNKHCLDPGNNKITRSYNHITIMVMYYMDMYFEHNHYGS